MKPHFYRPSALQDEKRFLAWRLGLKESVATPLMKRGSVAEQIALRGILDVEKEWVKIPSTLPTNPASKEGSRFKDWKAWSSHTGIDKDAPNSVQESTWDEAVAAAHAIRAALPDEFQWQVSGRMAVDVKVPDGFSPEIVGTCDLLLPEAVIDIKVVSDANERALAWDYRMQVSAYAHMHGKSQIAILSVFPIDDDCKKWSSKIVEMDLMPMETIEAQCKKLATAYRRAVASQSFLTDLSLPFQKAA
jgi:hypothetical protein